MKVLFDHSVIQRAITGERKVLYPHGQQEGRNNLIVFRDDMVPARTDWLQEEIRCIEDIANLCRQGKVTPYTTEEIFAESWRVQKFPSQNFNSFFEGIDFQGAQSPLDRSKWGLSPEQYNDKEQVIRYCETFFLSPEKTTQSFIKRMKDNDRLSFFEEKCLRNVATYKAITRGIDRTHYPDALHLWTAEENGLDVFLTLDKKFRNIIDRQLIEINCAVRFPSELANPAVN